MDKTIRVKKTGKDFICKFSFTSFRLISLGISIDVLTPNIEIHVPFGFFRIGWAIRRELMVDENSPRFLQFVDFLKNNEKKHVR